MAEGGSCPVSYQGVVECDGCEGIKDVNNYCIDCKGNICDKCMPVHCNTRLTKTHKVLPRIHPEAQRARRSRRVYCQQHHDLEYVNFCIKCQVPCCPRCIASKHNGHDFSELLDEISKVEKELIEMAVDLESTKIPEAKKTLDQIDRAMSEYEERGDAIKKSVKDRITEIYKEVDNIGEGVLIALENQRIKDTQQMKDTKKKIRDNVAEMTRLAETCRLAPADASLLLLKNEFRYLEPIQMFSVKLPGNITFEKSTLKLSSSTDLIGRIATGKTIDIDTTMKRDNQYNLLSFKDRMIKIKICKSLERKRGDTVLHMMNGQTWISDEAVQTISIFGERYNQIKVINLGFTCYDMALTLADDVIATDFSNDRVVRISSSGSITKLCSTVPYKPLGICVNNKQQIIVGEVIRGLLMNESKLVVYSSDGSSVLQVIQYDQSERQLFIGCINRVKQTVIGDYAVADDARVICLSDEWKIKWEHNTGSYVNGLCCNKYNVLYVAGDNNRILVLSSEGRLIDTLLTKSEPLSLTVDNNGQLFVGQKANTFVIQYLIRDNVSAVSN